MSKKEDIKFIKKHGFKAFKPERLSYEDESGQKWLQCKFCCEYQKVDDKISAITCSSCVTKIDMIQHPDSFQTKQYKRYDNGNIISKEDNCNIIAVFDGITKCVPIDPDDRFYKLIMDWVDKGNTIANAD